MITSGHLAVLINQCLAPMLDELSGETGKAIEVKVRIFAGEQVEEFRLITNRSAAHAASGEIRVVTRAGTKDEIAFSSEGVFPDLSPETGYSGFCVRGLIDLNASRVRVVARSNRYNVWKWSSDFHF